MATFSVPIWLSTANISEININDVSSGVCSVSVSRSYAKIFNWTFALYIPVRSNIEFQITDIVSCPALPLCSLIVALFQFIPLEVKLIS